MKHHAVLAALFGAVCSVVIACSASGNAETNATEASDGGPGSKDGDPPAPGPHPICAGSEPGALPQDFGVACDPREITPGCEYATNQCDTRLCVVTDGDPTLKTAICATSCSGADDNSCPSGYRCVKSKCAGSTAKFTCQDAPPRKPSTCTDVAAVEPSISNIRAFTVTKDSRVFVVGWTPDYNYVIATRDPASGKWSRVAQTPVDREEDLLAFAAGDTAFFVGYENGSQPRMLVATNAGVNEESLPTCHGSGCPIPNVVFAYGDEARTVAFTSHGDPADPSSGDWSTWKRTAPSWSKVADLNVTLEQINPLHDQSLLAMCVHEGKTAKELCASVDGVEWTTVPLPAGETVANLSVAGESRDDFFITTASGITWHRVGATYYREGLPPAIDTASGYPSQASFKRTNDGTVFATLVRPDKNGWYDYFLDGDAGCWRTFGARTSAALAGLPFGADEMITTAEDTRVCIRSPR